jgi:hypothetical protein
MAPMLLFTVLLAAAPATSPRHVEAVLTGTQVLDTQLDRNLRVRTRVVFFWEGARHTNEVTGKPERSLGRRSNEPLFRPGALFKAASPGWGRIP